MTQFRYTTINTNLSHQLSQIGFHFPNLWRSLDLITFSNSSNTINATGKEQQVFSFRDSRTLFFCCLLLLLRFFYYYLSSGSAPCMWGNDAIFLAADRRGGLVFFWCSRRGMLALAAQGGDEKCQWGEGRCLHNTVLCAGNWRALRRSNLSGRYRDIETHRPGEKDLDYITKPSNYDLGACSSECSISYLCRTLFFFSFHLCCLLSYCVPLCIHARWTIFLISVPSSLMFPEVSMHFRICLTTFMFPTYIFYFLKEKTNDRFEFCLHNFWKRIYFIYLVVITISSHVCAFSSVGLSLLVYKYKHLDIYPLYIYIERGALDIYPWLYI